MRIYIKGSQHEEGCVRTTGKEVQAPLPLPVELTLLGLQGDLATTKAISNGQEGQRDKDGSSIRKSRCHHEPLASRDQGQSSL